MSKKWKYEDEWFEETNVAKKIKKYLKAAGYKIEKFNQNKYQKGPDIVAKKQRELLIEVKGYPSTKYVRGKNEGKPKKSLPSSQARLWFSHGIFALMLEKARDPKRKLALGVPKEKTYEKLFNRLKNVLNELKIDCFFVDSKGKVELKRA